MLFGGDTVLGSGVTGIDLACLRGSLSFPQTPPPPIFPRGYL